MRLFAAFLVVFVSAASLVAQSGPQDTDTYEITTFAGVDTGQFLKDGVGEEASFLAVYVLWGNGKYLYASDGTVLRRIEIATRQVTTITRLAGSGFTGVNSMWGDGSYIYVTGPGVRRISLSSGLVEQVSTDVPYQNPLGIGGDGRYLYIGNSRQHSIKRVEIATGKLTDFAALPGPIDPFINCRPSQLNCFDPAPTSLSIDGNNLYATGFGTTLRIINTSTGEVTPSQELPFIPNSVWGRNGVVYFTEARGNRVGKLVLATGETSIIFPGDSARGQFWSIWGDGSSLYIAEADHVLRMDPATGTIEPFAGTDSRTAPIDGVGAAARFNSAADIWSDGTDFLIVDGGTNRIRRLDLATSQVTTLPTPVEKPSRLWADGTYFYVTSGDVVRRVRRSDGDTTTFGPLHDPNFTNAQGIWGDGTALYVSLPRELQRISLDGSTISTVATGFRGGESDVWGDGSNIYFSYPQGESGNFGTVYRYSPATGDQTVVARLPAYVIGIWGDGQNLFVTAALRGGSPEPLGRVYRIALATGEVHPLMRGGSGPDAGTALKLSGVSSIWGAGGNLYLAGWRAIYKLTPSSLPAFSAFAVPDRAAASNSTASTASTVTVASGSIELDSSSSVSSGLAIFTYRSNGIVVSEATVPATAPIRSGRVYASVAGPVNTGLAIVNPNDTTATINFYFTDTSGNNSGQGSFTIPARGQIARFLNESPFRANSSTAPATVEGTLTFDSSVPVSAIALRGFTNERAEFLMTTLPVLDLAAGFSADAVVMPHFAYGGGWKTSIVLVNPTDQSISGNLELHADGGSILSTVPYAVSPRSSFVYTAANSGSQIQTGSIRVVPAASTAAPTGVSIFSFQTGGVTVTEAGAPTVTAKPTLRLYSENNSPPGPRLRTGVAIANPSSAAITVSLQPTTSQGMPVRTEPDVASLTIPPRGHRAVFLDELFNPLYQLPTSGVFRIWTDSPEGISVTGVRGRYNERGDFLITTISPAPESPSATPSPIYFPHIVEGGGYTTQIIVFGDTPGLGTSGKVRYFSQSGAPLTVPLN